MRVDVPRTSAVHNKTKAHCIPRQPAPLPWRVAAMAGGKESASTRRRRPRDGGHGRMPLSTFVIGSRRPIILTRLRRRGWRTRGSGCGLAVRRAEVPGREGWSAQ
eukprot:4982266-Pleurochrysis_carterae.AAC.1